MKQHSMIQAIRGACSLWLLGSVAGCAQLNDAGLAIFSSSLPAIAIVDGQLVKGEIQLFPDHTGTVNLRSQGDSGVGQSAAFICVGRLRYTSSNTGAIDLRCGGGVIGDLKMTLLGETRGYGYGPTASGSASLVFGMTLQESRAHLLLPPDRHWVDRAGTTDLEFQQKGVEGAPDLPIK